MAPGRSQIHPPSDLGARSQLETRPHLPRLGTVPALTHTRHDRLAPRFSHLAFHVDTPTMPTSSPATPRTGWTRLFPDRHPHTGAPRNTPPTSKTATTSQLNSSRHPAPRPRSRWTEHPGQSRSEVAFCARRKHGEVAARRHYPRAPYHHARTPRGREGPRSPGPSGGGIGCRRIRQQCAAVRLRGPCRGAAATCPQTTAAPTPLSSASPAASPREKPPAVLHPLSGTARLTRCPSRTRRSSRPS